MSESGTLPYMPRPPSRPAAPPATPTTERTRRAIVAAAMETWAADRNATLADICRAGGIARSTLHRYFADRTALLAAVDQECHRQFTAAAVRAHPDDGPGLEAVIRLCQELLALGPPLGLVFSDNALVDPDSWTDAEISEQGLTAVIRRGQQDGTIDPAQPADWIAVVIWMMLAGAWHYGLAGGSRREQIAAFTRSLTGAIGTPGPTL